MFYINFAMQTVLQRPGCGYKRGGMQRPFLLTIGRYIMKSVYSTLFLGVLEPGNFNCSQE